MATTISIQEALELAHTNSKPYLKQIVKKGGVTQFMYSGRTHNANSFTRVVQKEREPLDTPKIIHMMLDRLFKKKWGYNARSQTIFCTGSQVQAELYGNSFLIFPYGNFKFLWHQKAKDLYNYLKWKIVFDIDTSSVEGADELEKRVTKVVAEYKNSGLQRAIKTGHEIMIHTKEYLALDVYSYETKMMQFYNKYGVAEPTDERLAALWDTNIEHGGIKILK